MASKSPEPFPLTGRYAAGNRWEVLGGPGDARPTALQIVQNEGLAGGGLAGKVIFMTGASSGMGPHLVRALSATGATIYIGARDISKARKAIGEDLVGGDEPQVHIVHLDQADMSSVRKCAADFREHVSAQKGGEAKLNIIINNAAVMRTPEQRTKDRFELQLATNHLSHSLLFDLLKDLLLASATPEFPSRVVSTTSAGHKFAPIDLDDLNLEREGAYTPWGAYGRSKVANIYMTSQIERLYGKQHLHGFAAAPGGFASPNLQQHCTPDELDAWETDPRQRSYIYNFQQACATAVYGAVAKEPVEYVVKQNSSGGDGSGLYLEGCSVAGPTPKDAADVLEYGYSEWAFDREKEERLWDQSKKLVGVE